MKSNIRLGIIPLFLLAVTAIRCSENCTVTNTSYYWEPVYTSFAELRAAVSSVDPIEISAPGKIYFKDNFLYINEVGKGIHVIDNTDPSSPQPRSFINIPGNYDLAIRNNILFADSYVDLVAIDITIPGEEKEIGRAKDMFEYYSSLRFSAHPSLGVVTDLREIKSVNTNDSDCGTAWMPGGWRVFENGFLFRTDAVALASSFSSKSGSQTGTAGSLARFALREDQLYTLDAYKLKVINVVDPTAMTNKKSIEIAWDIETIFPREDKLFIGSRSGMHIFDLGQPESPQRMSTYTHVRSCDPVVVEGDFAYVTLRSGTTCQGFTNQLEVIDIKNLFSPKLVKTYSMTNPGGLGIDNGTLFICDGIDGLKVFDATDNLNITQVAQYKELQAVDLIPLGGIAMVIGNNGLYQYDYSDPKNIKLLSTLEITPNE